MTLDAFAKVFAPLAVQLRQTDADEATIRLYFVALQDLELAFVRMAAERLARESAWFPKTSEWRLMAGRIEAERREAQRVLLRKLTEPLCRDCDDSGWVADAGASATRRVLGPDPSGKTDCGVETPVAYSAPRRRCGCQQLRRLELLGERPWPALPEAPRTGADAPLSAGQSATALAQLKRRGFRVVIRGMPAAPAAMAVARDEAANDR